MSDIRSELIEIWQSLGIMASQKTFEFQADAILKRWPWLAWKCVVIDNETDCITYFPNHVTADSSVCVHCGKESDNE